MYDRIVRQALMTPWLVTAECRDIIYGILRFRASGGRLTAEELKARIETPERPRRQSGSQIAVIPIWGVIANRNFDASSGMTSIESIRPAFRRALADEEVRGIILDINSPGGAVPGVPEFAAEIFAARDQKPVIAFVDDLAASAGYYLASQASEIVSIPTGESGSIGVYLLHLSEKAWLEKEGIKVTAITYGENKTEGAPWEDLSEETVEYLKGQVNKIGREFDAAVARGRNVSVSVVRDTFGQGRVFDAKEAKKLGLIDRVGSFDEVVARLAGTKRRSMAASASSVTTGDAGTSSTYVVSAENEPATSDNVTGAPLNCEPSDDTASVPAMPDADRQSDAGRDAGASLRLVTETRTWH